MYNKYQVQNYLLKTSLCTWELKRIAFKSLPMCLQLKMEILSALDLNPSIGAGFPTEIHVWACLPKSNNSFSGCGA